LGAAWNVADVSKGSTVVIFGLGTVGLSVSPNTYSLMRTLKSKKRIHILIKYLSKYKFSACFRGLIIFLKDE
jgi:Zn-dependent alcohol dehydrogenase